MFGHNSNILFTPKQYIVGIKHTLTLWLAHAKFFKSEVVHIYIQVPSGMHNTIIYPVTFTVWLFIHLHSLMVDMLTGLVLKLHNY